MDQFRIAVLGDGGVGKTAIAVQVRLFLLAVFRSAEKLTEHAIFLSSDIVHLELLRR
jgi:GTPase SAR1 family protein